MASTGYAISISAKDEASATIAKINRTLAAMEARGNPAAATMAKFSNDAGLTRTSEAMGGLASRSLDTFRSLDRIVPALGAITGAASIAGLTMMAQRFAEVGTQAALLSRRLGIPVDRLTALRGATRLAGGSAEDLDGALGSLDEKLRGATFGRDAGAAQTLNTLGVNFKKADGSARDAAEALGDVADGISRLKDRGAQVRAAQALGLEGILPLLVQGRAGIQALSAEAARLGMVITPQMATNATELHKSFTELTGSAEGLGNAISDKLSGPLTAINREMATWIANNKEELSTAFVDSITGVANGLKVLKALVLDPLMHGTALTNDEIAAYNLKHPDQKPVPFHLETDEEYERRHPESRPFKWWNPGTWGVGNHAPGTSPAVSFANGFGGASNGPPKPGTAAAGVMNATHDFWRGKGFTEAQTAGILANIAQESSFNPALPGDGGTSYGLYQHHNERKAALFGRYGNSPTADQQNQFAFDELSQDPYLMQKMRGAQTSGSAARLWSSGFERPLDSIGEAQRRAAAAPGFENGSVHVDVNVRGAPQGTTATVRSTGQVTAPPPRIEMAMPGIH
jgi:hypothetical protein